MKPTDIDDAVIERIGDLISMLRLSMQELGLSKEIQKAAEAIPDTQDQLVYISKMTEQAAHRALTAIDKVEPMLASSIKNAKTLLEDIEKNGAAIPEELSKKITAFLQTSIDNGLEGKNQLMEITMAQDFQDLTSQVILKMTEVIKEVQHQLLQLMVESSGNASEESILKRLAQSEWDETKSEKEDLLNGPQIKPTAGDAVSGQSQVDSLLDGLGL